MLIQIPGVKIDLVFKWAVENVSEEVLNRFLIKIDFRPGKSCWRWIGAGGDVSYGQFGFEGKVIRAHVVSFLFARGPFKHPCVLHRCDNPPCVRPSHLFSGTKADNNWDKVAKGRTAVPCGEQHKLSKLSEREVRLILKLHNEGITERVLAGDFKVSPNQINLIVRRKAWKHVRV